MKLNKDGKVSKRKNMLPYIKPDAALAVIIGSETIQTHNAIKNFWTYIKNHNLKIRYVDYRA